MTWAARRTDLIFDWSTKFVGPQIYKRVNDRQGTILLDLYHSQTIISVGSVHILILPTRFYSNNDVLQSQEQVSCYEWIGPIVLL